MFLLLFTNVELSFSHQWCTKQEDRRRVAIGFEIPVIRGAFDQGEESTDDVAITKKETMLAVMSCETQVTMYICRKVGECKQLNQPRSW